MEKLEEERRKQPSNVYGQDRKNLAAENCRRECQLGRRAWDNRESWPPRYPRKGFYEYGGLGRISDATAGWTDLHKACLQGDVRAVRKLAANGGQSALSARNEGGQTPLKAAIEFGRTQRAAVVQALLEAGADAADAPACLDTTAPLHLGEEYLYARRQARDYGEAYGIAALIWMASDEARRLCGALQRLVLAKAVQEMSAGTEPCDNDVLEKCGAALDLMPPSSVAVRHFAATCYDWCVKQAHETLVRREVETEKEMARRCENWSAIEEWEWDKELFFDEWEHARSVGVGDPTVFNRRGVRSAARPNTVYTMSAGVARIARAREFDLPYFYA